MFIILLWILKRLPVSILIPYCFLILSTTVLSRASQETAHFDFTPLRLLLQEDAWMRHDFLRQMRANALMFEPIGFLMPQAGRHGILEEKPASLFAVLMTVLTSFLFSFTIEYLQWKYRRGFSETDDIISNTIGAVTGVIIYLIALQAVRLYKVYLRRRN